MGLFDKFKSKAPVSPPEPQQHSTVLIIDDEQLLRTYYTDILTKNNYVVLTAQNGSEGLLTAAAKQPNVILLDIVMPQMDGIAVLRQLKENPTTKAIPVIMLSSAASIKNMETTESYAAYTFLNKSTVTPQEIISTVTEVLAQQTKNPILSQIEKI